MGGGGGGNGGVGGGRDGWLLGNNNALLTDWERSLSLLLSLTLSVYCTLSISFSLSLSRSVSSRAGSILPAVARQQLFELPVALATAAGENGGWW